MGVFVPVLADVPPGATDSVVRIVPYEAFPSTVLIHAVVVGGCCRSGAGSFRAAVDVLDVRKRLSCERGGKTGYVLGDGRFRACEHELECTSRRCLAVERHRLQRCDVGGGARCRCACGRRHCHPQSEQRRGGRARARARARGDASDAQGLSPDVLMCVVPSGWSLRSFTRCPARMPTSDDGTGDRMPAEGRLSAAGRLSPPGSQCRGRAPQCRVAPIRSSGIRAPSSRRTGCGSAARMERLESFRARRELDRRRAERRCR